MSLKSTLTRLVNNFKAKNNRLPNYAIVGNKKYSKPQYKKIINKPTVIVKTYNSDKTLFSKSMATAIGHKFDTVKESLVYAKGLGYKDYFNDVYKQVDAVNRLAKRLGINCSDACQLWYQLAKDMGYSVRYVHVKCSGGTGHIQLDIKGHEYGNDWVRIDPAAVLKGNVSLWCKGAKIIGYDEQWLKTDDGKT